MRPCADLPPGLARWSEKTTVQPLQAGLAQGLRGAASPVAWEAPPGQGPPQHGVRSHSPHLPSSQTWPTAL